MIVLPDSEDRMIVASFIWTKHLNVTDRQTDKRTDTLVRNTAVPALQPMRTRCKNGPVFFAHPVEGADLAMNSSYKLKG